MLKTGVPIYASVMLMTGIGIPVMAALNASLGSRLGSAPAAAAILFSVAFAISILAISLTGPPAAATLVSAPPLSYLGGILIAFYVLSITFIAPRFGLGNAVFFVLLGQIATAAAIDHFGLLGVVRSEITPARMAGIALMALGVYLARKVPA